MLRQSISKSSTRLLTTTTTRSFSALAPRMGAGDTGAPRPGGSQHAVINTYSPMRDSFVKREAAQENLYVHEKEMEKLRALKAKLNEQRKHLDELDKHIDEFTKNQGGEQN